MRHIAYAFVIVTMSCALPCIADDNDRGRLADGRAFRTDSQGNQLVDYIAELELSIEALNRQVAGLEGHLETKQAEIDRLSAAGSASVTEKTLIEVAESKASRTSANIDSACSEKLDAQKVACEKQIGVVQDQTQAQCRTKLDNLNQRLELQQANFDKQLADQRSSFEQRTAGMIASDAAQERLVLKDRELSEARIKIATLEKDLNRQESESELIKARAHEYESELERSRRIGQQGESQLDALNAEIKRLSESRDHAEALVKSLREELSSKATVAVSVTQPQVTEVLAGAGLDAPRAKFHGPSSLSLNNARRAAVDSLRGSIKTEINKVSNI